VSARARWGATHSETFGERRSALLTDDSLQGSEFARAFAALVDEHLSDLFGDASDCALVAVGGYGRGELAPGSDIDVILVHRGRRDVGEIANRIWYPIWDAGIPLDHSVKTVTEALGVAARDLKAAMGLLSARCVAGDEELRNDLARRALDQWVTGGKKWLRALGDAVQERHARMGDVAFLLEPDLKEGRGGLRDVIVLRAAALASPVVSDDHLARLDVAETLVRARVALQRTGGRSEQLVLQSHEGVAHALGLADADALMRGISSAARTVAWVSDEAWRRIDVWLEKRSSRSVMPDREESPGVVVREGETALDSAADLTDPSLVLRVGAAAASTDTPIATATLERLRADAMAPGSTWTPDTRAALFELLAAGPPSIAAFEALDQYDLLARVLPEWEPVRSKPQHNPYHRYTVDRHLIECAVEAAALRHRVTRPDLLLLGAWLHDLGKGYPGDHSVVGAELMEAISTRMSFPSHDREVLVKLARDHLLLSDAATRRDVRDPGTVTRVAEAVGDMQTLELMHALSEADGKATGPSAWSPWKAALVDELVAAVAARLAGRPEERVYGIDPALEHLVAEAGGGLLVHVEGSTLVVVSPDRPGLFYELTGVLCLHGLEVVAADLWSAPGVNEGMAVDTFVFHHLGGGEPDWARFHADLERALEGGLALEARIADRARDYRTRFRGAGRPVAASVVVDNEASADASVVEVRGPDAMGALYRIARAFSDMRLDIRHAKVLTLGHEIVDSFYVVDLHGKKLTDSDRIRELERAVLFELSRLT